MFKVRQFTLPISSLHHILGLLLQHASLLWGKVAPWMTSSVCKQFLQIPSHLNSQDLGDGNWVQSTSNRPSLQSLPNRGHLASSLNILDESMVHFWPHLCTNTFGWVDPMTELASHWVMDGPRAKKPSLNSLRAWVCPHVQCSFQCAANLYGCEHDDGLWVTQTPAWIAFVSLLIFWHCPVEWLLLSSWNSLKPHYSQI